jgi:hypothetical protein
MMRIILNDSYQPAAKALPQYKTASYEAVKKEVSYLILNQISHFNLRRLFTPRISQTYRAVKY